MGRQAAKGVFITTGTFTHDAQANGSNRPMRIVRIDAPRLAMLMIEHNVGVSVTSSYQIKAVDSDAFMDE